MAAFRSLTGSPRRQEPPPPWLRGRPPPARRRRRWLCRVQPGAGDRYRVATAAVHTENPRLQANNELAAQAAYRRLTNLAHELGDQVGGSGIIVLNLNYRALFKELS